MSTAEPQVLTEPRQAAAVLAAGNLVGIPTETVYGLAADAANPVAVARVFAVKGRPADHPLIVHLAAADHVDQWAAEVPPRIRALLAQHWPGPLTVVLPKQAWVPAAITGGQDTVALRVPGSAVAREVIAELGRLQGHPAAVVAPSANRFGQVSPTSAAHVLSGLSGRLTGADAVLDGGECEVGVESTIVAAVGGELRVLRPGAVVVPVQEQRPALAPVVVPAPSAAPLAEDDGSQAARASDVRAPGTLAAHYAPSAEVVLVDLAGTLAAGEPPTGLPAVGDRPAVLPAVGDRPAVLPAAGDLPAGSPVPGEPPADALAAWAAAAGPAATGLLAPAAVVTPPGWVRLAAPADDVAYARALYAALRAADAQGLDRVVAVPPTGGTLRAAVLDRLGRAATGSRR